MPVIDVADEFPVFLRILTQHVSEIIEEVKIGHAALLTQRLLQDWDAPGHEGHGDIILELFQLIQQSTFLRRAKFVPVAFLSTRHEQRSEHIIILLNRSGQNAQIFQLLQPVEDITEVAAPAPAYILKGTGKILPGFQILLLFGVFEIRVVHEEANRLKQLLAFPGELLINPDIATFIVMKAYIPVIHQKGKPLLKHILRIAMQQLEGFRQLLKFFPVLPAADLHILLPVNCLRIFIREDCRIRWDACFRWMFRKQHTAERVDRTHKAEVDIL